MTPVPLSLTDLNTRILITLFLVTMLIAIGVSGLIIYDKVGRVGNGVTLRYGPEAATRGLDVLPPETDAIVARMNTFSLLLDATHAHVFELPLVLFVLAHFLMRTRAAEWFKLANYLLSSLGTILFLGSPWLVRYVSTNAAPLFYMGASAIAVTSVVMIAVPIWEMWTTHDDLPIEEN